MRKQGAYDCDTWKGGLGRRDLMGGPGRGGVVLQSWELGLVVSRIRRRTSSVEGGWDQCGITVGHCGRVERCKEQ